jgi:hypothetical protein
MTKQIRWDDTRFYGEVYAVIGQSTIARISERGNYFDVFYSPDAPPVYKDERDGITMDSFRTLEAAKSWIKTYVSMKGFPCAS